MTDIPALTQELRDLNHNAMEATKALPLLLSSTSIVSVTLADGSVIEVPSVPHLQEQLSAGNLGGRVGDLEALSRGMIQEIDQIASESGLDRISPYWTPLDLEDNSNSDLSEALFRANVEEGLRLPYDGFTVNQVDRKFESGAARIGDWLLPSYTETVENRWTSAPAYSSRINVNQYPIATEYKTRTRSYTRRSYRVGHYYRWLRYRRRRYVVTRSYTVTTVEAKQVSLQGSMIAQTFRADAQKVLTGLEIYCYTPGAYAANNPRVILCETQFGQPDLNKVIAHGTFVNDAQFQGTSTSIAYRCTVELDRPVLLEEGKSYAFIVAADGAFHVIFNANNDTTGGVFYTQDAAAWNQQIAQDIAFGLRVAQFADTETTIEIDPVELSGGIASIKQDLQAEVPVSGDVQTEFELNGSWFPVEEMDELTSLPPHTPMRLVMTGTADAMPFLYVPGSTVTGLRPATQLQYFSKERKEAKQVRITYELIGFEEAFHTFDPGITANDMRYAPSLIEHQDSADGNVRSLSAVFDLPSSMAYRHDIKASTITAAKTFDISSIIELNT
ncbi:MULTISPECIES: hypothetical protein [unclassified Phaeobacter]|uniref:hypothetical protein n=1 Tax=unclassified Phaeobacter TaxID=2621772 RepID=UPI003A837ACB